MGTEIRAWQIVDGKLTAVTTSLKAEGKTEPYDLEPWLASNPEILGPDIAIIGRQVPSKSGPIDLLGLDKSGNSVVVEIKRDRLPRDVLAQAIDYASDVADWTVEKIGEVCTKYSGKSLDEFVTDAFPDVEVESLSINAAQRILLVGFSVESSLERMIEWLSDTFGVNVNAVVLSYFKTSVGDELLAKTTIISEELEQERVQRKKKFVIPMSDDPGAYETDELRRRLVDYLSKDRVTNQRIRDVLLPASLRSRVVTRAQLKEGLLKYDPSLDASKVGYHLTIISSQLGMQKNAFMRQVLAYEYPNYEWEKDNFSLRDEYRTLVAEVLQELNVATETSG